MKKWISVLLLMVLMCVPVCAEEVHEELGTVEEVTEFMNADVALFTPLYFVRRVGVIGGHESRMYFTIMRIGDLMAYCIEPAVYAGIGQEYEIDWGVLDEATKEKLFKITNVGYQNYGHDDDKWFMATQLAIWRALGMNQYYAMSFENEVLDLTNEIEEIETMAEAFGKEASFNGQTLNMELGVPVKIKDTHGVVSRFEVKSVPGVDIVQNGDELTVTIIDRVYQNSISDSQGVKTGGLVYVYPGKQTMYTVHRSPEPVSYHLYLNLKQEDLKIVKMNKLNEPALGIHYFDIVDESNKTVISQIQVKEGIAELEDALPRGTYSLVETKTEYPYQLSSQPVVFEVQPNQKNEVVFVNEYQSVHLVIIKKDAQSQQLLDGAEFVIEKLNDENQWELVKKAVTSQGKISISELRYNDTVRVCELKAPEGYMISQEPCQSTTLTPEENTDVTLEFANEQRMIDLTILKRDEKTMELLNDAQLSVSLMDEHGQWVEIKKGYTGRQIIDLGTEHRNQLVKLYTDEQMMVNYGEFLTDDKGVIDVSDLHLPFQVIVNTDDQAVPVEVLQQDGAMKISGLKYGQKIKVCEVTAPVGYKKMSLCEQFDLISEKDDLEVFIENELRQLDVILMKKDALNGDLLNDAYFTIDIMDKERQLLKSENAMSGRLVVHTQPNTEFDVYRDQQCSELLFSGKTDASGEWIGECCEGVVYVREKGNPEPVIHEVVEGGIVIKEVEYGSFVRVCEVIAPSGYQLAGECIETEVKSEQEDVELSIENERIPHYEEVPKMGLDEPDA